MSKCGEIQFSISDHSLGWEREYRARCKEHKFKGSYWLDRKDAEWELQLHRMRNDDEQV